MPDWDFYGNQWAVQLLKSRVAERTLKHAYLITGPQNVGKTAFAKKFSQSLFCEQIKPNTEPCGSCVSCSKIEREQHFDLKVARKAPGARDFKLEQVLDAEKFLSITPYSSPYKVVVFPDFGLANAEAQNAILKTLEEAPSYSILILIAENDASLLPTVLSRCEKIDLRNVDLGTTRDLLLNRFPGDTSAELAARLSNGRPGLAIRYCNPDGKLLADREKAIDDFFTLIKSPFAKRFEYSLRLTDAERISSAKAKKNAKKGSLADVEENADDEDLVASTLNYWLLILRDALILGKRSKVEIINFDREVEIAGLARMVGEDKILIAVESIQEALRQNTANVNKRLLLDVALIELFDGRIIRSE